MTNLGSPSPMRKAVRLVLTLGCALLLTWTVISAVRLLRVANSLQEQQETAVELLEGGLWSVPPDELQALAHVLRQDVLELQSVAAPLGWLGPYLNWIPRYGPILDNAPVLLEMADAASRAGLSGSEAAAPVLNSVRSNAEPGGLELSELAATLEDIQPALRSTDLALTQFDRARSQLEAEEKLPWRVRQLLAQYDQEQPFVEDWLDFATMMPALLPADEARTYLILAQNEDELRPTGGFISGAGLLRLENGRIVSVEFDDANLVDAWQTKPYPEPPAPLISLMGSEMFLFRDANYWPDFPYSAMQAMRLYEYGQDQSLDGVIAIDQQFLQLLLQVTGPIAVPELGQAISANNVIEQIRSEWEPSGRPIEAWMANRKSFMGPLAKAMLQQILAGPDGIDPVYLLRNLHLAFEQRHLQVYVRADSAAATLSSLGWDGHQVVPIGWDYLQVVDFNIGFNKVGSNIVRRTEYEVTIDPQGQSSANVSVTYENHAASNGRPCQHGTDYSLNTRYTDLVNDCYWNFVRLYAVAGAELISASEHPLETSRLITGARWSGQAQPLTTVNERTSAFGNVIVVPPGGRQEVRFEFMRPPLDGGEGLDVGHYRLYVQKQAGLESEPIRVTVRLPEGATVVRAEPQPESVDRQTLRFQSNLTTDQQFVIQYQP